MKAVEKISDLGEDGLIARLRARLPSRGPGVRLGLGDDAAVIEVPSGRLVVTVDAMVEGVHFRRDLLKAEEIGHRLAAANLSDLAAMGARPMAAVLSLGLMADLEVEWLDGFLDGLLDLAAKFSLDLVGGDTVRSPMITASLTALGRAEENVLTRSGARAGQVIVVSGTLGDAAAGLMVLEKRLDIDPDVAEAPVKAFARPMPQVGLGLALAKSGAIGAAMDLSDGLAADLPRLCLESGLGAEVDPGLLPLSAPIIEAASKLGRDPRELALGGGEDFGLLFTCHPDAVPDLAALPQADKAGGLTVIGRITAGRDVNLIGPDGLRPMPGSGFDHF